MTMHDEHDQKWWDDRVEAYIDETLSTGDITRFEQLLLIDEVLHHELETARKITDELRSMPVVESPDDVTNAVMASVRKDLKDNAWGNLVSSLQSLLLPRLRPAVTMAVLLAVVVSTALLGGRTATPAPEVTQALEEVKLALAYLSDRTRRTGTTIRTEALEPLVVLRMQKTMDTFMEN